MQQIIDLLVWIMIALSIILILVMSSLDFNAFQL